MTYEVVDNFAAGLDVRKSPLTAPGGTLTRLTNAAISPGGEIEKRRAFVKVGDNLLAGTFGLASTEATLYAFSRNVDVPPPDLAAYGIANIAMKIQKLPNAATDLTQIDYDSFDGKLYVVCAQPSGATDADKNPHYYDAVRTQGSGKGYYIRTYQSKVYSIGGKYLYFSAINDPLLWDLPTSADLVTVTSLSNSFPAVCTVSPADMGKFAVDRVVVISGADTTHAAANGPHQVTAVDAVANTFTLGDVNTAAATAAQTTGVKVNPKPATGAGFINLSLQDSDSEKLTSIEVYYDKLAILSSEAIQLWAVDPDPLQNAYVQLLRGAGTTAPRSTSQYGSGDVLYLDRSGIRSMKAKDSSNSASVSDIGSPIDRLMSSVRQDRGQEYADKAVAMLEPYVGRFWMVFPEEVYVLSYFPGPDITAWSKYETTQGDDMETFTIEHAVACGGRLFFRSGDDLIIYGGPDGASYDHCEVDVWLPYLNGKKPGHNKTFEALDMSITGEWHVHVSYDFNQPEVTEVVGTFSASTWNHGRAELQGYGSHISLHFHCHNSDPATLSNIAIHYKTADDEQ
jgi:hypothetical protein